MRNNFVYTCSIKIYASRIPRTVGKHFLPPFCCGNVYPTKRCRDTWSQFVSQFVRGQVIMADKATLHSPIHSIFEASVMWLQLGIVTEEYQALFVDLCWLQTPQFLVHLSDLLSILLSCHGFTGIQKAVVN